MVTLLKPIGHCFGVIKAIELARNVASQYQDKHIFVFGLLVHNEEVINYLDSLGVKTVDTSIENPQSLLEKFTKDDIVIFTAHGHPAVYEEILNRNGVTFFDATCTKVKECFNQIKEAEEVIYIGKDHHPETIAALTMNKNAHLYDIKSGFNYDVLKSDHP